jgi:hypothetical protein
MSLGFEARLVETCCVGSTGFDFPEASEFIHPWTRPVDLCCG